MAVVLPAFLCNEVPNGDNACGWLPEPEIGAILVECRPFCECVPHVGRVESCVRVIDYEAVDRFFAQTSADDCSFDLYPSCGGFEVVGYGCMQFGCGPFAGKLV